MADSDNISDVFEEIAAEAAETKARLDAGVDRMTVERASIERMTQGVPSDPQLSSEWHLTGTWGLHADLVWPDYTGSGIRLADFDDGFQYTHPDLAPNYDTTLDRDVGSNDYDAAPSASDDDHGTAVMGVMIADDNGSGIVGVAFDATGVGIRQSFSSGTDAQTLQGFQYALTAQVDVMNNSWGYTTPYSDDFAEVYSGVTVGDVGDAMQDLVDQGRGGRGTSVVFAAGNEGDVGDNVNYHNFQNSPYAITVAAIDSSGHVASFSTPGAALLVAAGGVNILTTDRTGSAGYENSNYATVDGTSFAAPAVSGVIALMLEANPDLGWRDVQQILAYSAQHNDPTSSGWQYNGATNWNGGGLHFSHDYGFGAADAFTAVRLAELWGLQQTSADMTTFTTATSSPNLLIRDNATVSTTINVTQDIFIEHVQIHLDINHTWAGDLIVTLISPDGTESVLVNHPGTQQAGDFSGSSMHGIDFTVGTNADWGESSLGTWTLEIQDTERNDTGTLASWNITFLGHTQSSDDVYVYTNALAAFSGAELTARSTISDTDGGSDTLNITAVTTASTINLATGTGTVAGKAVTISGIDNVFGGDGNDRLTGDGGDNRIAGGRGTNTLDGGSGTDTAVYAADIGGFSFSLVSTSLVYVTHAVGYTVIDTLIDFELFEFGGQSYTYTALEAYVTFYGSAIRGTTGNDSMSGTPGADTFAGGTGNDTYVINDAGDYILENSGEGTDTAQASISFTLNDNVENITLSGTAAIDATGNTQNNSLTGNSGNNTLDGATGADRMAGLSGNDTYIVDNLGDVVAEAAGGGTDVVYASVSHSLAAEIYVENLVLTGTNNLYATGNSSVNTLTGNSGDNTLDGGAGVDTLIGGSGNDTYLVDTAADVIIEQPGEGSDTVRTAISYTLSNEVESLVLLGSAALNGTGNAGVNTITGTSGINTLNGGAGADTLIGGAGNDIYYVDEAGDVIIEDAGAAGGIDTAYASGDHTLSANVEKLVFAGAGGGFTGTGNALANTLTGNAGDNTLDGGAGADKLIGGLGNDTYIIDMPTDSISEAANAGNDTVQAGYSYTLAINLENITLIGTSSINATGNTLVNILTGNAGSNILNGLTGADTMAGGAGDDFYFVDNLGDVVQESAGNGNDSVRSTLSFTLGAEIENLMLLGSAAASATGNALNNSLTGNTGINTLNGDLGADTMAGLGGNDTYFVDDILDLVFENTNGGTDTVQVGFSYTLGVNVEKLLLTGAANIDGTGNTLANTLTGNSGDNTLDGGSGADKMYGGLGNDTYIIDSTTDGVTEAVGAGHDTVRTSVTVILAANVEDLVQTGVLNIKGTGNALDNTMFGNSGNSTLDGSTGADFLDGGFGNDTLTGGTGADIFAFSNTSSFDKVTDFSLTQGDQLDISDILIGFTTGVSEITDYVSFATVKGVTTISVDADGTGSGTAMVAIGSVTGLGTMTVDQLFDAGKIIV